MTTKRFDIILVDRIDQNIDKALNQLSKTTTKLENAQERLSKAIAKSTVQQDRLKASVESNNATNARNEASTIKLQQAQERLSQSKLRTELASKKVQAANISVQQSEERLASLKNKTSLSNERYTQSLAKTAIATNKVKQAELATAKARAVLNTENKKAELIEQKIATERSRSTVASLKVIEASQKLRIQRQALAQQTNRTAVGEQAVATAKLRTEKANIDVTRSEVALQKARASVNRQSAVVVSANGQIEASNEKLAASNRRVAATANAGSSRYKAVTANARQAQAQTSNLIFQVQDIIVGLQGGQKPLTVLLQQGAQIQGAFGPGTGVIAILKGVGRAAIAMVAPFAPFIAVGGAVVGVFALFNSHIQGVTGEATSMGDTFLAVGQVIWDGISGFVLPIVDKVGNRVASVYGSIKKGTASTINFVIGYYVGGYNAIVGTWSLLPSAMGDLSIKAANLTISAVEGMINFTISGINTLVAGAESVGKFFTPKKYEKEFGRIGDISLNQLENKFSGKAGEVKNIVFNEFSKAFTTDFVSPFIEKVSDKAVANMKKRVRKELEGLGKNDTSRTEAINREAKDVRSVIGVYGDYGQALATAKKRTELLIEAKKKNIDITPGVTSVINDMASAYGRAVANLERANQLSSAVSDINKSVSDYAQTHEILNEALSKGLISQNQYNAAIGNSSLVQNLNDIRLSLTNTAIAYEQTLLDIDRSTLLATNAVENAFKAGVINIDEKIRLLRALEQKSGLDKSTANDNRTQGVRDFDKGLGGKFKDNAEIKQLQIEQKNKLELLRQYREQKLLTQSEYNEREKELARVTSEQIIAIENARKNTILAGAIGIGDSLTQITGDIAGKQSAAYKVMFAATKAFAIADSIIKIQQGIASALALPFPASLAAAAGVATQAASIVSNIKAVSANGFRTGGFTGNGNVAGVAGVVHNNEFVIPAGVTAANRPALESLNRTGRLPSETPKVTPVKQEIVNRMELINETGVAMRMVQIDENRIRLIAEEVAGEKIRTDTPKVIKADLANPNSDTSKALGNYTTASRKYG